MAEAESMATVHPAARNLCAAATYMRLRETVRCPQNIGTNIPTTTATVAALGRFNRKVWVGTRGSWAVCGRLVP